MKTLQDRLHLCGAGKSQAARPAWVAADSAAAWDALITHCGPLVADCNLAQGQLWGPWANSLAPEAEFPANAAAKLNAFQRLLLIQVKATASYHLTLSTVNCPVPAFNLQAAVYLQS